MNATPLLKDVVTLCKKRGFIFHASEIYGGVNGFWDYGPLGTELKNNIRNLWWESMVHCSPIGPNGEPIKIVGLDSSIIQSTKVWEASGHLDSFSDPMVDCKESKMRYRADNMIVLIPKDSIGVKYAFIDGTDEAEMQKRITKNKYKRLLSDYDVIDLPNLPFSEFSSVLGPDAKTVGTFTELRNFNLMFKTEIGALANQDNTAYLRPETAQGIFINYKNILNTYNLKLPFGIAQIGKAFRNEITPRNYIFRSREFEQMELEWFCHPQEAQKWYEYWKSMRLQWWIDLGINPDNIRLRTHETDELAHYAKTGLGTADLEFKFPFSSSGFGELEGIAHRGDFDLLSHQNHSKLNHEYHDIQNNSKFLPHVIEPSAGLNRGVLAVLFNSYTVDENRPSGAYLKLPFSIAPIKAAILPLINKDELNELAKNLFLTLRKNFKIELDSKNSIGKRYAKHDEIGTPFCITIDQQSLEDNEVTIRYRDSMKQIRINISDIENFLTNEFKN